VERCNNDDENNINDDLIKGDQKEFNFALRSTLG
jgi:hypothetical protein